MALADGPPGEIRGGFHFQDHGSHLVRRAPFKSANQREALALIMHARRRSERVCSADDLPQ
jgi:hypothetical protein